MSNIGTRREVVRLPEPVPAQPFRIPMVPVRREGEPAPALVPAAPGKKEAGRA